MSVCCNSSLDSKQNLSKIIDSWGHGANIDILIRWFNKRTQNSDGVLEKVFKVWKPQMQQFHISTIYTIPIVIRRIYFV